MQAIELKSRLILKPLYEAISENDNEKVKYLLTSCDNSEALKKLLVLNQVPDKRRNPLNVALKSGSSDEIIKVLLESGADPNEHVLHSPFLLAIRRRDLKSFKLFIEYGGNPLKSPNIMLTALKNKYYDEGILKEIADYGIKVQIKSKKVPYPFLIRVLNSGSLDLVESVLTNFQEISRTTYKMHHPRYNKYLKSPIADLINSGIFKNCGNGNSSAESTANYEELFRIVKIVYKMMTKEDRQQTLHDFNHSWGSLNSFSLLDDSHYEYVDLANKDLLEIVLEDLKCDFDINSVYKCGDKGFGCNAEGGEQNLLVCAFRYRNEDMAEQLIKLGADLSRLKFQDLSLIYRLSNRDRLLKLLIAAGFRLPHNFDIWEFVKVTDFRDYVLWTGSWVDYYINEKMIYLYKVYATIVPQYQLSLRSLSRESMIKNYNPYNLKLTMDKLPPPLKAYLNFNDCNQYDVSMDNLHFTDHTYYRIIH